MTGWCRFKIFKTIFKPRYLLKCRYHFLNLLNLLNKLSRRNPRRRRGVEAVAALEEGDDGDVVGRGELLRVVVAAGEGEHVEEGVEAFKSLTLTLLRTR